MSDIGCWGGRRLERQPRGQSMGGGRGGSGLAWPRDTACVRRLSTVLSRDGVIIHCQPIIYRHWQPIVPASPGSKTRVGLDLLHCAVDTGG